MSCVAPSLATPVSEPADDRGATWFVAFGPDDTTVVVADDAGRATEWDLETGQASMVYDAGTSSVNGKPFATATPSGDRLAIFDDTGVVTVWDIGDAEPVLRAQVGSPTHGLTSSVSLSPDGSLVAVFDDRPDYDVALVVDVESGDVVREVERVTSPLSFSSDSESIVVAASGEADGEEFVTVMVGDVESGDLEPVVGVPPFAASVVAFDPDGETVAAGSSNGWFGLYDAGTLNAIALIPPATGDASVDRIEFSPAGERLVVSSRHPRRLTMRDGGNGRILDDLARETVATRAAVFSPDGTRLVSAEDVVVIWDVESGDVVAELDLDSSEPSAVARVAFSHDGSMVAGLDVDGSLRVWDVLSGEIVTDLDTASAGG